MIWQLCLTPWCPNEVRPAITNLFIFWELIIILITLFSCCILAYETFLFLPMPATATFYYLSDWRMVIARANIKSKEILPLLRFDIHVFLIQDFV